MIRDCYRSHEVAVRLRSFYERSRAGRETLQNETARTLLTKYAGGLVSPPERGLQTFTRGGLEAGRTLILGRRH